MNYKASKYFEVNILGNNNFMTDICVLKLT